MNKFNLLLIFIFSISISSLFCQNCEKTLIKCDPYGEPFKYSEQSKSAFFEKGQKSSFYMSAFSGTEYSIRICASKTLENIYFRIRENNSTKDLLYDSSTEEVDYLEKQFYVENTKKLIIEVIVPESMDPEQEKYKDRTGCVGVLIEYHKAPKKGF
ncbi:MAG: hypothetical protein GXO79_03590 [Chlorobi bacterium]|nr:hypothetical protein [Chlorobiota bacterium]